MCKVWIIFAFMAFPAVFSDCSKVKYADDAYDDVLHKFFNSKMVLIAYSDKEPLKPVVPGIFIDFHLILTSFNAFKLKQEKFYRLSRYKICVLKGRTRDKKTRAYVFKASTHEVLCARQIIPYSSHRSTYESHGFNYTYTPLHDLMVFRINPREYAVRNGYSLWYGANIGFRFPKPVHIAKQFYELRDKYLMIASLGFRDYEHMRDSKTLISRRYFTENMLTDCDEWLPRWWGYFICLKNVDNFNGIGSGAVLIHQNALFGIGSFMLSKRNNSILVFTDVRPYYRMFGTACHEYEATEIKRTQSYDRDEFWYYAHHERTRPFKKRILVLSP